MTDDLPDHVRVAVTPPRAPTLRTSDPERPGWPGFRGQNAERVLLYGTPIGFSVVFASAGLEALVFAVMVNLTLIVPGFIRWRQDARRDRQRGWRALSDDSSFVWNDLSGEWSYAGWQSRTLSRMLRWLTVLAMPALWIWASVAADSNEAGWPFLVLTFAAGSLVYFYRHLPTSLHPQESFRLCFRCGRKRPAHAPDICSNCRRMTDVTTVPALPALHRRWRDW